jgi:cell fate regulator YaaT (PSP1 superfamily)
MATFVEIRFKGTRRAYYANRGLELNPGSYVFVEADRGEDLGEVTALGTLAERKCSSSAGGCATPTPEKKVLRVADPEEVQK